MPEYVATKSICPVCFKTIDAKYIKRQNRVYLEKSCEDHGDFSCLISSEAGDFDDWHKDVVNIRPRDSLSRRDKGCPHDCGPCEEHLQTACCVLIDVTTRCDQACPVCFASAGQGGGQDVSLQEIESQLDELARLSEDRKFNIQLSGGEPAVHEDLPKIISMAKQRGFEYVQLNTNGRRIAADVEYARQLKEAGLDAVFLQFDGTNDEIYHELRNEKLFDIKKAAVKNCGIAKLPVALVPTVVRGINDGDIGGIIDFMLENLEVIRGVHFQPVSLFGRYPKAMGDDGRITLFDIMNEIAKQTGGRIDKNDLMPLATGHNLCCFYGTFLRNKDGRIEAISRARSAADDKKNGDTCCEESENAGCCCDENSGEACCLPDIEIIKKDRDYVKNRWKIAEDLPEDAQGFDRILEELQKNSFTLTGMAFQDAYNFDVSRVSRCRVQVFDKGRLIPFCAYNLTNSSGEYLYRK